MLQVNKRKRRAKFSGRKHSVRGHIGLIMAILALGGLLATIYVSFTKDGNAELILGSMGIFSWMVALVSLIIDIGALMEEEIYKLAPVLGTILGTVGVLSGVGIYAMGILY